LENYWLGKYGNRLGRKKRESSVRYWVGEERPPSSEEVK
jgi:hypothetical protein